MGRGTRRREINFFPSSLHTKRMFLASYLWFLNPFRFYGPSLSEKLSVLYPLSLEQLYFHCFLLWISPHFQNYATFTQTNQPVMANKAQLFRVLWEQSWSRNQTNVYLPFSFLLLMTLFTCTQSTALLNTHHQKKIKPQKCLLQVTRSKTLIWDFPLPPPLFFNLNCLLKWTVT